jgi:hypothetical protein
MVVRFGTDEYNLIHIDEEGKEIADTFHTSIEDALKQAELEFTIGPDEWLTVDEVYRQHPKTQRE